MDGYEYLKMLKEQGDKEPPRFGEFSVFLERKARKEGVPINGQFELTPLCNLSCKMCYVHLTKSQLQGQSLLTAEQWKDLMHQAFTAGMFQATLTGGECLTYPGFEEVYLYLHSLGCQVDILTNGVLLDEERIRFFKAHPPAFLQITLYGADEDSYERVTGQRVYQRVIENIQRVREAGFPFSISITPNRFLGEGIFDTIRKAKELSGNLFINTSLFVPAQEPWRMQKSDDLDVETYVRILRFRQELDGIVNPEIPESELPAPGGPHRECDECGLYCGGGRSGFVINWKGEMCICNRMEARSYPLRDGFSEAWRRVHEIADSWPRVPECQDCAYEEVCDKCVAGFLEHAEAGKQPKAICEQTRYKVSHGILPLPQCET